MRIARRNFLMSAAAGAATAATAGVAFGAQGFVELPMENGRRPLAAYPQKRLMIVQANRPPILETPFSVFDSGELTPNDAFFVRWHEAGIPTTVDVGSFRLNVHGLVNKPLSLTVAQ